MDIRRKIESAFQYFQSGNLQGAEDACRKVLKKQPDNIKALHFLGMICSQRGHYEPAIRFLKKALHSDPHSFEGFYNLGRIYQKRGETGEAVKCFQKVVRLNPDFADAYLNMGNIFRDEGNTDEAIACYKKIIALKPDNAGAYFNLGVALQDKGDIDEAIVCYRKALALNLSFFGIYNNLGLALQNKGVLDEALACYQEATRHNPQSPEALYNMGNIFKSRGQLDEAISCYRKAIRCNPNYVGAYNNLGTVLKDKGLIDAAISCYQDAIRLDPDSSEAFNNLGVALHLGRQYQHAVFCFQKALSIKPDFAGTHNALGTVLKDLSRYDEAEEHLRLALRIDPDFSIAHSNLLLYMNYNSRHSAQDIYSEHLKFAERFEKPLRSTVAPHANGRVLNRRLKIGYVSPDFRRHSVNYFIEPVLASHDNARFEVFCYSDVVAPDNVTKRLQEYADQWRDIVGMPDEKVAELIRKDGIDILVDLAGHTGYNRMLLFARKPAPVQVSWIGYPNTTGLSAMDYRLVDSYTDPPGLTDPFYTERLIRMLESFLCYLPDKNSPDVESLPALKAGHVTFGSFNFFAKVTPEVMRLWREILAAVPDSHLIMKAKSLSDKSVREYAMQMFTGGGIAPERIELLSYESSYKGHLDIYNRVDISLDPFPYNGTTTTCESLWMGVPVITLAGNTHASRVGASLLSNVGLPELIADTGVQYVEIAAGLAADLKRLESLRRGLRTKMQLSPLCDAKRFTSNLEELFQSMWRRWCESDVNEK